MSFESFNFAPEICTGLKLAGYAEPTPIQTQAIPHVMEGKDVVGLAQTGTGKTAAFVLPILQRLMQGQRGKPRALVIAPTRELAEQIHSVVKTLGSATKLRSVTIYGGVSSNEQARKLRSGCEIVVACPGRLLDQIQQRNIDLRGLEVLVLDEADQMFDMGFFPSIRKILNAIPKSRQTLFFSATMPDDIRSLANECLRDPVSLQIDNTRPASTVTQAMFPVMQDKKTGLLLHLLKDIGTGSVLVFTRTKHRTKRLADTLDREGFSVTSIQGNLSQNARQSALNGFRAGKFQIMVATDIAARGIDVSQVSHVINYDIPDTIEAYTHRIGRTGRAARTGDAFTLITHEDRSTVRAIEKFLKMTIEKKHIAEFSPPERRGAHSEDFSSSEGTHSESNGNQQNRARGRDMGRGRPQQRGERSQSRFNGERRSSDRNDRPANERGQSERRAGNGDRPDGRGGRNQTPRNGDRDNQRPGRSGGFSRGPRGNDRGPRSTTNSFEQAVRGRPEAEGREADGNREGASLMSSSPYANFDINKPRRNGSANRGSSDRAPGGERGGFRSGNGGQKQGRPGPKKRFGGRKPGPSRESGSYNPF